MIFPYSRVLAIRHAYKEHAITRREAGELLTEVLDVDDDVVDYGPLLRLSDVCKILRKWAEAFSTKIDGEPEFRTQARDEFRVTWGKIELAISKSNLLARLFFTPEDIRTAVCPDHKGKWSGRFIESSNGPCACQNAGNVTGWLPTSEEHSDLSRWDSETKSYRK